MGAVPPIWYTGQAKKVVIEGSGLNCTTRLTLMIRFPPGLATVITPEYVPGNNWGL